MCGRYYIADDAAREIKRLFGTPDSALAVQRAGDVLPSGCATVLIGGDAGVQAVDMRWGFPGYDGKNLLINARSESALEKRTFRDSVLHRRCVVPASGFYEWNQEKEKFTFHRTDQESLLFMAGCFNLYQGKDCFVILTTQANASMAPVHDRMPLILEKDEVEPWLSNGPTYRSLLGKKSPVLERSSDYEQMSLF